jgi:multidrug efflux pump subunit AcrA (membrane-fusion protein)
MDTPHHRRDFVRVLTLGASAAALSTASALRADVPKIEEQKKDEAPKTEADARMELVLARFGKQLDADARKAVRAEIDMITRRAQALRKFALENGDGPYPVFHPFRAPLA